MRGRLATECHYSQEYISETNFLDVQKMSAYWNLEPPLALQYYAVHFQKKEKAKMNILPNTKAGKPFNRLPEHIKKSIIGDYIRLNPGKTAEDFELDRAAKVKQRYAKELTKARQEKA
jgi:hypothetical protein